ncbi:MAG: TetR/AcrR family transcriptional regulator [Pseudomonadota bacterium]
MPQVSKREVVIDAAIRLFKQNGVKATSVDEVINEANVSKKTLYNHFNTKDELVLAALRKDDEIGRNALMKHVGQSSNDIVSQILSIFDFYDAWFNSDAFNGCFFIRTAAELKQESNVAQGVCADHKRLIQDYIEKLLRAADINNAELVAERINILLEGATVYAQVMSDKTAAKKAKSMAIDYLNGVV